MLANKVEFTIALLRPNTHYASFEWVLGLLVCPCSMDRQAIARGDIKIIFCPEVIRMIADLK